MLNYTIQNLLTSSNKFELVYRIINIATSNKENLLKYLEGITENYNSSLVINVYKQFAFNSANDIEKYNKYFDKFLNNFKKMLKNEFSGRSAYRKISF